MLKKLSKSIIVLLIFSILMIFGCERTEKDPSSETRADRVQRPERVKIGVFEPLSGAYQYAGNLELEGIQLANELYPVVDGIKLELVVMDNQSDKIESARVVSTLVQQEGVTVLIGSWSSTLSISAGPILRDLKVPAVAPTSTNQEVTLGNDYYFRACYVDSFQGTVMANYAFYDLDARTAVVVTEKENEYSKGLARFFVDRFIELNDAHSEVVLLEVEYDPETKDYQSSINDVMLTSPDVIFLPGGYYESANWIVGARENGVVASFLGGDTWDNDVFLTYGGKAVEGATFSTFYASEIALTPESTLFAERYRDKYGKEPTAIAALGYDAYLMVLDAVKRSASSDPEELRKALREIKELPGAAGMITIDENGDTDRVAILKTIDNSKIHSIKSISK